MSSSCEMCVFFKGEEGPKTFRSDVLRSDLKDKLHSGEPIVKIDRSKSENSRLQIVVPCTQRVYDKGDGSLLFSRHAVCLQQSLKSEFPDTSFDQQGECLEEKSLHKVV